MNLMEGMWEVYLSCKHIIMLRNISPNYSQIRDVAKYAMEGTYKGTMSEYKITGEFNGDWAAGEGESVHVCCEKIKFMSGYEGETFGCPMQTLHWN